MWTKKILRSIVTYLTALRAVKSDSVEKKRADWDNNKDSGENYELEMKSKAHPPDYIESDGGYPENQPKRDNFH